MTKNEILQKYEDDNEYHFHEVDRVWILQAMEEYAKLKLQKFKSKIKKIDLNNFEEKFDKL